MTEQTEINALRALPIAPQGLFMDGAWVTPEATLGVTSPIDGATLTTIADATVQEVARATACARRAYEEGRWRNMPMAQRRKVMLSIAEQIEAEALSLAVLGVRDNGTELSMALKAEPGSAAATFRYYGEAIDKMNGEIAPTDPGMLGLIHREPVGVVGAIVPWNFPLMIGAWKLAPALAAGNSVVLKPAESASLSLLRLAEIAAQAGLPDGVLNVVTGRGAGAGAALAHSNDVDALVFTGSGATGRRLLEASAASNLKRVYLELGGKSPNVVFADAPDLDAAAKAAAAGIFRNSGQVCVAGSRLLVEQSIAPAFTDALIRHAEALTVGDPLTLTNQIGAINSEAQLETVLSFMGEGDVLTGGKRILAETGGTYMAPTILGGINSGHRVFREEVFGPVLTITPFETEAEALSLANATDYGLAAGVWTANLARAHRMVSGIRSGVVHVNTYGGTTLAVPMAGMKQSGNGADRSLHALEKYTSLKTAWIKL